MSQILAGYEYDAIATIGIAIATTIFWAGYYLGHFKAEIARAKRDIDGLGEVIGTERSKGRKQNKGVSR